jgi:hypothetical protein
MLHQEETQEKIRLRLRGPSLPSQVLRPVCANIALPPRALDPQKLLSADSVERDSIVVGRAAKRGYKVGES